MAILINTDNTAFIENHFKIFIVYKYEAVHVMYIYVRLFCSHMYAKNDYHMMMQINIERSKIVMSSKHSASSLFTCLTLLIMNELDNLSDVMPVLSCLLFICLKLHIINKVAYLFGV